MALASTIYLALMGRQGLINVAKISYSRAHLLHNKLMSSGFKAMNKNPFYNEFLMKAPEGSSENISSNLLKNGILGGINLAEDKILICCTEMNTVQDIESFISLAKEAIVK
jgi:glycine dehydrogenase subunit 1